MLTFDEAVEEAFGEGCGVKIATFYKEASSNPRVRDAVVRSMIVSVVGTPPTEALICLFLTGVAVGRAMEKQELPQV